MTKAEYKIYAEDLIQDISNRIDELRQRSTGINDEKREHFDNRVKELTGARDELLQKLNEFDEISDNGWEEAKADFKKAMDFLKEGFESLFAILAE